MSEENITAEVIPKRETTTQSPFSSNGRTVSNIVCPYADSGGKVPRPETQGMGEWDAGIEKANKLISEAHEDSIGSQINGDPEIQNQIISQAKQTIQAGLGIIKNKTDKQKQDAAYDANKDACQCFGYDIGTEVWKTRIMKFIKSFWDVVFIFTIDGFIVVPVTLTFKIIRHIIKISWLSVLLAILLYVAIILLILFRSYLQSAFNMINYI